MLSRPESKPVVEPLVDVRLFKRLLTLPSRLGTVLLVSSGTVPLLPNRLSSNSLTSSKTSSSESSEFPSLSSLPLPEPQLHVQSPQVTPPQPQVTPSQPQDGAAVVVVVAFDVVTGTAAPVVTT